MPAPASFSHSTCTWRIHGNECSLPTEVPLLVVVVHAPAVVLRLQLLADHVPHLVVSVMTLTHFDIAVPGVVVQASCVMVGYNMSSRPDEMHASVHRPDVLPVGPGQPEAVTHYVRLRRPPLRRQRNHAVRLSEGC